jgi:hypothetical protein
VPGVALEHLGGHLHVEQHMAFRVGGSTPGVSARRRPLMELVARSECCVRAVSPTLVLRTHYTVCRSTGLVGFRRERRRVTV